MTAQSRIWTPLDFDRDGKQFDRLRLPISTDLSAYGFIPIPLVCIRNGDGPTAVLIAGSHGDEYEGQIALMKLARQIEPKSIAGRMIILPQLNAPAAHAGRRVSPVDEGNLNRVYPGRPHGTATEMIAHYVTTRLLPMADLVIDLHSGGRSLDYVPCALVRPGKDAVATRRLITLLEVFGAPIGYVTDGKGGGGNTTLPATADDLGVPVVTTELGGGATLSSSGLKLAMDGVIRLLAHSGIMPGQAVPPPGPVRLMEVPGRDYFVYADQSGLFEPAANVGEEVEAGQIAGYLHASEDIEEEPRRITFGRDGLVACRRFPTSTQAGDCLFCLMRDLADTRWATGT